MTDLDVWVVKHGQFTLLKDGVLKMVSAVKSAGKSVFDAIVNAIKGLPQNLLNIGKSAITDLAGSLKNGWSTVKSGAAAIFDGIVNYFKGLPSKLLDIGKDLVKGLWNGISDMTGWVIGKIQGFGESVLGGIKSFFGIKSPSKEMAWVGEMLDRGLAEGMLDNLSDPVKAMQAVSRGVMGAADDMNGLTIERQFQTRVVAAPAAAETDSGILAKLDKILTAIEKGQILTIDGDQLVGATAARYDSKLGQRRALAARGAV